MRSKTLATVAAILGLLTAPVLAGVSIEDWADGTDNTTSWGGPIGGLGSRWSINTTKKALVRSGTNSGSALSSEWAGYNGGVSDISKWWNLSGQGLYAFQFTYTNTGTAAQDWQDASYEWRQYLSFSFKRYSDSTSTASNFAGWHFAELLRSSIGSTVVAAGQTVILTGDFNDYDWVGDVNKWYNTRGAYGWDTANDRIILGGWKFRTDYTTHGSCSPFELGELVFIAAGDDGGAPIPEPAGLGLVGLGLMALRRRRS